MIFSRWRKKKRVEECSLGLLDVGGVDELGFKEGVETVVADKGIVNKAFVDYSEVVDINTNAKCFDDLFEKVEDIKWRYVFIVNGEVVFVQLVDDEDIDIDADNGVEVVNLKCCIQVNNGDVVEVIRTQYVRVLDEVLVESVDEVCCKIILTEEGEVFPKFYDDSTKIGVENLVEVLVEICTAVEK